MTIQLQCTLNSRWKVVADIREKVAQKLAHLDQNIRNATILTASELMENAVKYGFPKGAPIEFNLKAQEEQITLSVSNRVGHNVKIQEVATLINVLEISDDPAEFFGQQIALLAKDPYADQCGLGLYRIVYEGGFALKSSYQAPRFTITATRNFASLHLK